jgi:uncharacterized protein YggE
MKALNNNWVTDIKILGVSNKKINQYRQEVEVKAMKAAKEKATYLLESIGEEVGVVVSVNEIKGLKLTSNTMHVEGGKYVSASYSKVRGSSFENIPEIRLSYTIQSKFKIK